MANRPQQLTLPPPRSYTRTDFTALRAFVQRVPLPTIARLYFDPDTAPHAAGADALERYLRTMRDDLVQLALLHGSSVLADHLKASIRNHGSAKLTAVTLRMVEQASRLAAATPVAAHPVGLWFRPLVARRLVEEGIPTLGALVDFCNRRGGSWWRAVPRIGVLRAQVLVAWLRRHAGTLGVTVTDDVGLADPLEAPAARVALLPAGAGRASELAPLERVALPHALSGGEGQQGNSTRGINRAPGLCYLQAQHDLDAVRAWLHRYRDRPQALRAYTREVERLLLWAVTVRGTALSSLTVDDCEAYKDFLAVPSAAFTGPRTRRDSPRWRPFTPDGLSPDSQRYAVRALRAAFDWLVDVHYLAGNPWQAVSDPVTVTRAHAMRIERALPLDLWARMRRFAEDCGASSGPTGPRWRAARAALLLMGDSGLRNTEAALARREQLRYVPPDGEVPPSWELEVVGKGRKQRIVPVSGACLEALSAHWRDRGLDLAAPPPSAPLVAPLVIPATVAAQRRHAYARDGQEQKVGVGYSGNGFRELVNWAVRQIRTQMDLTEDERRQLASTTPHAFRHTFGTQAAVDVPLDVVQQVLGHASLQTTTIYVQAERKRVRRELAGYYQRMTGADASRSE
ncbi:phage integrase family protein [Paraburkholderia dipogonis]|uniref:phage integrase family protein n=1 Tax=Paraburkholderia dipogonis TaxID=1211383 RepID=UPI0038BD9336